MSNLIYVFDPTESDPLNKVRGIGRYLQILKENFNNEFVFINKLPTTNYQLQTTLINPFFNLFQPPLLMRKIAGKQVAIIHDLIPLKYPKHFPIGMKGKLNIYLNKLALKNYDIVITDSVQSKRDIVNILGINDRIVKVIYPILPKIFCQKNNDNSSLKTTNYKLPTTNFCLYVGDATWNKNLVNLAKAIKIINVTCVFVGKVFENNQNKVRVQNLLLNHPWQKEYREFLEEVKDDKRFIFAGFVPDKKLIQLYQNARLNILVSRDEGFGFPYLEASSQKTPSVLSNIAVFKEIARDTACFANPHDPHDIANKIGEIYFNPNMAKELGRKALERFKHFNRVKFKNEFYNSIAIK